MTFQTILGCEKCLCLDISGSQSSVTSQSVSEVKMCCLFRITASSVNPAPTPFPFYFFEVEDDGSEEVLSCVGGRSFRSVRERWWYIALSKCGVSTDL